MRSRSPKRPNQDRDKQSQINQLLGIGSSRILIMGFVVHWSAGRNCIDFAIGGSCYCGDVDFNGNLDEVVAGGSYWGSGVMTSDDNWGQRKSPDYQNEERERERERERQRDRPS